MKDVGSVLYTCTTCGEKKTEGVLKEQIRSALGDVNQDGSVTLTDAQLILKYALKILRPGDAENILADVNEDSGLSLKDAQLVLRKALKIINNYDDVLVNKVTISNTSASIEIGQVLTLNAAAYPDNAINKTMTWSSSNNKVATVSNGVVRAQGVGTATITASAGGYSAVCVVTVVDKPQAASGFVKLKDYIINYGSTNSDGDKFISMNDSRCNYGISYKQSTNDLKFIFTMDGSDYVSAVTMTMSANGETTVRPEYAIMKTNLNWGFKCYTAFNVSDYSKNSNVHFYPINLYGLTESQIQDLSNTSLRAAFISWEILLQARLQMLMRNLGFTAYQ